MTATVPLFTRPLQRELSRLHPISPEIDPIVDLMYEVLDDPNYDGNPEELLLLIKGLMEEHDSACEAEAHPVPEEIGPDPGLFPEDISSEVATPTTPEALDAEVLNSFSSSMHLQHIVDNSPAFRMLAQDRSFSMVLKRVESFLAKYPDSDVATVAEEPGESKREKVDGKPKRLGSGGTWVNDSEDKVRGQTPTIVQRTDTVSTLQRQDTLTD